MNHLRLLLTQLLARIYIYLVFSATSTEQKKKHARRNIVDERKRLRRIFFSYFSSAIEALKKQERQCEKVFLSNITSSYFRLY